MIKNEGKYNFTALAELREGHGYFILPATRDVKRRGR